MNEDTFKVSDDVTASLNYNSGKPELVVRSESLGDYNLYRLDEDGLWTITYDSLSKHPGAEEADLWCNQEFLQWARQVAIRAQLERDTIQTDTVDRITHLLKTPAVAELYALLGRSISASKHPLPALDEAMNHRRLQSGETVSEIAERAGMQGHEWMSLEKGSMPTISQARGLYDIGIPAPVIFETWRKYSENK